VTPAVFKTTHRIRFSDLDPYGHMRTAAYAAYFIDHRMDAVREQAGWGVENLETLSRSERTTLRTAVGAAWWGSPCRT
jgi:acyl-CoA thioesterase FadM